MPIKGKFISKKKAVTYRLVPKSQLDPTADTSEHVLVPVDELKQEKFNVKLPACAVPPPVKEVSPLKKKIPAIGPQPDWDPDIVAALDDGFNHEDVEEVLEEDFIALANGSLGKSQAFCELDKDSDNCDEPLFSGEDDGDDLFSDCGDEENTRHTQCSLTSAVTNCDEDFQIFNKRFDKFYETYEAENIGALECDRIEGYHGPNDEAVKSLEAQYTVGHKKKLSPYDTHFDEELKLKTLNFADTVEDDKSDDEEEEATEQPPEYDCESIISTYSRTQNLPGVIKMEKKVKPVKITANPRKPNLTKSALRKVAKDVSSEEEDESSSHNETVISSCVRSKYETPEERRLRKQAVKQNRRENRMVKKENKLAFKEEKKKRESVAINARRNKVIPLVC